MSKLIRGVFAVALAAALSTGFGSIAHADPASPASYQLSPHSEQAGDPIQLNELAIDPQLFHPIRRINWGDGSAIQVETEAAVWSHTYAKAGTFHVSVEVRSDSETGNGNFPDGNTVQVFADAPPELLSATYHLVPDHVRVNTPVTLNESAVHGDETPPAYLFRFVTWGDGTPEEEYSGHLSPKPHKYAKPGTYHVSVRLVNLQWHTAGKFPEGNTVTVTGPSAGSGGSGSGSGSGAGGAGGAGAGGAGGAGAGGAGGAGSANGGSATGDGGGLPVTGPGTAVMGAGGVALVLAGAITFTLLRRRRIPFVR
jgi:hypothetical protein